MEILGLRCLVLTLFITIVQCRILTLHTSDDLISDGMDRLDDPSVPVFTENVSNSTCQHQYGFLPCAENAGGYVFLILVYQGLLIFGEQQLNRGTKVLFNILGTSKIVGIIFRILIGLPSMLMMIVSGVFSSKEDAESTVSLGVGIFAGITVFTLTVQWGICLIFGSTKLPKDEEASTGSNCLLMKEAVSELKDNGVTTDKETRYMAGIMLLSLIPYVVVQLPDFFKTSFENHLVVLIGLIVSSTMLLLYFVYQVVNPWMQLERSLAYSKYELLRTGFLKHLERYGNLINEDGKLNLPVIKELFSETDKDADKHITKGEMERLMLEIIKTGEMKVDKQFAVNETMRAFDFNDDEALNYQEFVKGCTKWIAENKQQLTGNGESSSKEIIHEIMNPKKEDDPQEMEIVMSKILTHAETELLRAESLVTEDGNPNIEGIKKLFKKFDSDDNNEISKTELEELIRTVKFGEFRPNYEHVVKELFDNIDKDRSGTIDELEFVDGLKKWVDKAIKSANSSNKEKIIVDYDKIVEKKFVHGESLAWTFIISLLQVLLGIVILTFMGGPLMGSILQLSYSMSVPSFGISFVIVPIAMNTRAALAAIVPASHKSKKTASLTFSEIYGGVVMSNISNLTALLAIVYAKDLTWSYSAEVLTVLVVCALVGILAYSRTTYPLWTCLVAFFLYPFSLGLFYYAQFVFTWH